MLRRYTKHSSLILIVILIIIGCQKRQEVLTEDEMQWLETYQENDTVIFTNNSGIKKYLIVKNRSLESHEYHTELGIWTDEVRGSIQFNSDKFNIYLRKRRQFTVSVSGKYIISQDSQYIEPRSYVIDSTQYKNVYKINLVDGAIYFQKEKGYLKLKLDTNNIWNYKTIK